MSNETERQQIEASKTDHQYFEPLYTKYYEQILKFVYNRIESLDDSREVTSIVFAKAMISISKYNDYGFPFSSWLYRIAINEINQFYRETSKMRVINIDEKQIRNIAEESNTHQIEQFSLLKKALIYLSEKELLLIELRYFEGRAFAEIAQILSITENNAKVKTYRIIDKLKVIYNKLSK